MITFQVEKFAQFVEDAKPLFPLHYKELALNQDKIQLALDLSKYEKADSDGYLFVMTARDEGELVGYYTAALLPHLHYCDAGIMASTDMYFLLPAYRKGNAGPRFLLAIEAELRARNVKKIYISCKAHHDLSKLFKALGYGLSDYMFTKLLEAN